MYPNRLIVVASTVGCLVLLIGALLLVAGPTEAAREDSLVLVELFTSEGCSSCPPADRLLSELLEKQPVAGVTIVPMSFHVDYWDRLGWKDPFGDPSYSQRQRAYAGLLKSDSVYTPQMIVNGVTGFVGSDRGAANQTIARASTRPPAGITLAVTERSNRGLTLQLDIEALHVRGAILWAAVVEDGLASDVKRGENAGRNLPHDAVVRVMQGEQYQSPADGPDKATLTLPWDSVWKRENCRAIAAVQGTNPGTIYALGQLSLGSSE